MKSQGIKQHTRADLVVLGAGGSGLAAAVSAAESGVKDILVIETRKSPGGNSLFPAGIFGAETRLQKRLGANADKDKVFRRAMEYAHWKLNGKLVRALIEKSADTIEWLGGKGVVFDDIIPLFNNFNTNTYHSIKNNRKVGALVVQALLESCRTQELPVLTNSRAQKIQKDKAGNISSDRQDGIDPFQDSLIIERKSWITSG